MTAATGHDGGEVSAGPPQAALAFGAARGGQSATADTALVTYLKQHQDGATWLVAVSSANQSATIQLASGQPVMAIGGFSGTDPAISLTRFKSLVASGKLRYFDVTSGGFGRAGAANAEFARFARAGGLGGGGGLFGGTSAATSAITSWVKSHGTTVAIGTSKSQTLYQL